MTALDASYGDVFERLRDMVFKLRVEHVEDPLFQEAEQCYLDLPQIEDGDAAIQEVFKALQKVCEAIKRCCEAICRSSGKEPDVGGQCLTSPLTGGRKSEDQEQEDLARMGTAEAVKLLK